MSQKEPEGMDEDAKRLYQQAVLQQALEFDKQLVWLAGGAIALVAAFVAAVKPTLTGVALWSVGVGLFLLLASMATTLTSFQVSIADSGAILRGADDDDRLHREKRMRWLNGASLVSFVLGVVAFVLFAYLVLPKGVAVSPKKRGGMPSSVPTKQTQPAPKPAPAPKPPAKKK